MESCLPGDSRKVTPVFKQLHSDGAVVTEIQHLLLKEETDFLLNKARQVGLEASTVVGDDGAREVDQRRTSRTAFLPKNEDGVIACIERRIAAVVALPTSHLEPLQVTDYRHKQQYQAHHDYFNRPNEPERTTTVFAYLKSQECDDGKCGGATIFHELKNENDDPLKIYPKVGNAVMWSNRTHGGEVNPKTLHSGEALTCEHAHKVGLNAWFRDAPWE